MVIYINIVFMDNFDLFDYIVNKLTYDLLSVLFPELRALAKWLGLGAFPRSTKRFFTQAVTEMIKQRKNEAKEDREVSF